MEKEQTPWRKTMSRGDSRNNAHPGPNIPSHHRIATSSNKALNILNLIKISKNIFISNVLKGTWPFKSAIINQGVPHTI